MVFVWPEFGPVSEPHTRCQDVLRWWSEGPESDGAADQSDLQVCYFDPGHPDLDNLDPQIPSEQDPGVSLAV